MCTDDLQSVHTTLIKKIVAVPSTGSSSAHGMAAAGPAAGPSTSKKVLDLNLYSDLNQNQEVSLTFSYFSLQQMHQCEQRRAVDLKFKCTFSFITSVK